MMPSSRLLHKVLSNSRLALRGAWVVCCAACGVVGRPPRVLPAWHLDSSEKAFERPTCVVTVGMRRAQVLQECGSPACSTAERCFVYPAKHVGYQTRSGGVYAVLCFHQEAALAPVECREASCCNR